MTNNFSTIQNNQASEKFYLVRVVPRRLANDLLSSIGGGQYSMPFSEAIQKVTANGAELTLVDTVTGSGEYSYDGSTLIVYSTPSDSNGIVIHYFLFYTGDQYRTVTEDPEDSLTELRLWSANIRKNPQINNSIENVIAGNIAVATSTLSLINQDNTFENYLTVNDSFNKAELKIWLCLDSTENIQAMYDGRVATIGINDNIVDINFDNPLAPLLDPAFMGDDSDEAYYSADVHGALDPNANGRPIPYVIGVTSRYKLIPDTSTAITSAEKLDPKSLMSAVNLIYSTNITTSTNREWGICRVSSDGLLDFSFTPSNIDQTMPTYTRFVGTAGEVGKFRIGDTFVATYLATPYYYRIIFVDRVNNWLYCTKDAGALTGATVAGNDCPGIVITDGVNDHYYPVYGRDYTTTVSATSSGNKFIKINFVTNFEANVGLASFDVGVYIVKYRVRPDTTNAKHGSVLESIINSAGITTNSTSFSDANTAFDESCVFSIPYFDQLSYSQYIRYVENLLSSTLGYITLNNDFEIEYNILSAPSSVNELSEIDIIKDSINKEIKYRDVVNEIIAFNPHYSSSEAQVLDDPSVTLSNNNSKFLHDTNNTIRFRHLLQSIDVRLPEILKIRANRYVLYDIRSKIINVDNILGDDIKLVTSKVLGTGSEQEVKIMSITKSPKETRILASDLHNI